MELMRNWIINIIIVVILSAFAEMIIPNGSFKKYAKLVIGLIVMMIIIKPIVYFSNSESLLYKYTLQTENNINKLAVIQQNEFMEKKQMEQIVQTYQTNLRDQITQRVKSLCGSYDAQVSISADANLDSSGFGSVREINVKLLPNTEHKAIAVVNPIETVNVSKKSNNENIKQEQNEDTEEQKVLKSKIKDMLRLSYNVPVENITVEIGDKQ